MIKYNKSLGAKSYLSSMTFKKSTKHSTSCKLDKPKTADSNCLTATKWNSNSTSSKILHAQTWWKRLLQLVSLLGIEDTKSVEILGAANLELHNILASLDLHGTRIFPSGSQKEILYLMNLLRHDGSEAETFDCCFNNCSSSRILFSSTWYLVRGLTVVASGLMSYVH